MLEKNEIIQSALQNLKIESLNPMQEAALEQGTGRKDVILLSPTGSGKTLAYLLPLLLTLKPNDDSVQVLILVPSRELALQIDTVFRSMGTSWKTCCCYGGHPIAEEKKSIAGNHPAIILGTPGRITDHLSKGNFDPETIETLIIDEFDKSLEFGFHDEMAEIITQLPGLKKRMLLSATDAEEIPQFTGLNRTVKLDFLPEATEEQENRLKLMKVLSPSKDKIDTLYNLLCSLGSSSSIVFCNHRDAVDRVHKLLEDKKLSAERFHGGMEQPDRERALYKFRNGSCHVLISTDLAARGLDIPEISLVAILDADKEGFLRTETSLIQTIGRAARNAEGHVIMYADTITESMEKAISETERRRKIQQEYNEAHGITPQTIKKAVRDLISISKVAEADNSNGRLDVDYESMSIKDLEKVKKQIEKNMRKAAAELDFEQAAMLRDKMIEINKYIYEDKKSGR